MRAERAHPLARAARRCLGVAGLLATVAGDARAQMPGMPEMKEMMRWESTLFVLFDQLEYSPAGEGRPANIEALAWYGGAYNRLWVRASARSRRLLSRVRRVLLPMPVLIGGPAAHHGTRPSTAAPDR